ncbi:hypothetical protein [Chitinimonas sp.]|uniref:hypothetical protein n=1 Tax=Chitinimonas sp. TaxID=1934313 RepID=UPI002F941055
MRQADEQTLGTAPPPRVGVPWRTDGPVFPITRLCGNVPEVGKSMQAEFVAAIAQRAGSFKEARALIQVDIDPQGNVSKVVLLNTTDEQLGPLAVKGAGRLKCAATGQAVTTFYPVVFTLVDG